MDDALVSAPRFSTQVVQRRPGNESKPVLQQANSV